MFKTILASLALGTAIYLGGAYLIDLGGSVPAGYGSAAAEVDHGPAGQLQDLMARQ